MTMKKAFPFLYLLSSAFLAADAQPFNYTDVPSMQQKGEGQFVIQNRILTIVRDNTISVLDVVKKMDLVLNRHYPEALKSNFMRYQFYASNWRATLMQMIDDELILADAEAAEIKINDGDIRETMQQRFGPNIMSTLDSLGLSYEEARDMTHRDMVVQRMVWFRVNSKALVSVNSKDIKDAYQKFCVEHPPVEEWNYQVITIRKTQENIGKVIAGKAYQLLDSAKTDFDSLVHRLKTEAGDESSLISVSRDFKTDARNMSQAHKEVVLKMHPGEITKPVSQLSRVENALVDRIYYLKDHVRTDTPSFYDVSHVLHEDLLQEAVSNGTESYIYRLRKRYGFDGEKIEEMVPSYLQPFSMSS